LDEINEWLAVVGEAKHKAVNMRKKVIRALYFIFFAAAILLLIYRMYLRNNNRTEEAETMKWIALGLLLAALLCRFIPRLFPKWLDDKAAREIENKVHND
jgi:hypothetical protein